MQPSTRVGDVSFRQAGATGLHLSQGERSTLDAFQSAAVQIGNEGLGVLVPFYRFYPAVESFLDSSVKRTIDQSRTNHTLEAFDTTVLTVLFLIRYIDELPQDPEDFYGFAHIELASDHGARVTGHHLHWALAKGGKRAKKAVRRGAKKAKASVKRRAKKVKKKVRKAAKRAKASSKKTAKRAKTTAKKARRAVKRSTTRATTRAKKGAAKTVSRAKKAVRRARKR